MARNFSGSDVIDCDGATGVLNVGTNATIALSCWVNFNSLAANQNLISKGFDGNKTQYYLATDSTTTLGIFNWNGSAAIGTNATHGFSTGAWHHVYGDYFAATAWHIYFDGNIANTNITQSGPSIATPQRFGIGAVWSSLSSAFVQFANAKIADVGAWNAALTAGEVAALARGMRPYQIRPQSLIGYWPVDGIQSTEPDLSGNGHNGTLTGTTFAAGPPMTMFTPRWPMNELPTSAPSVTSVFRKTASRIGTRVGTRQTWAA